MRLKQTLLAGAVFSVACALLIFPAAAASGARKGIDYCLRILIPSLYPFMVLAVFVVKSGLSEKIGKLVRNPTRALLRLPGSTAAAILMSMIGGYPTGARSIAALYESGCVTERQAARMLCFCVNAGPPFVVSAVGAGFLRSVQAGWILFVSQIAGSVILSLLSGVAAGSETVSAGRGTARPMRPVPALIASAADAARGMMSMCGFVVLFAALISLVRLWVASPQVCTALSGFLEVTGGCSDFAKAGLPLWAVSFILGWGGVCVHFQVISSVEKIRVPLCRFLFYRVLHGAIAALVTVWLLRLYPLSAEAFSNTAAPLAAEFSGSVPAATALIVLCAAFLAVLPHENVEMDQAR